MEKLDREMMIQILRNQMALLACSQQSNMHDAGEKARFWDAAFGEVANTRLLLDEVKRSEKKE